MRLDAPLRREQAPTLRWWQLLLYLLSAWLLAIVQSGFLSHLTLFGVTLELVYCVVCYVSYRHALLPALLIGVTGGAVMDALDGATWALAPLVLAALAVLVRFFALRLRSALVPYLLCSALTSVLLAVYRVLTVAAYSWRMLPALILVNLALSALLWLILRFWKPKDKSRG